MPARATPTPRELVANLANPDKSIQSDCIKVLYEIGALKPELIADYADGFIALLRRKNNRLVWGGMTALGSIVHLRAAAIGKQLDLILETTERGSVIMLDWGVRVLATVSTADPAYAARILPFLKTFLQNCPPKDVPGHAESVLTAIHPASRAEFIPLLEARKPLLTPAQAKRLERTLRKAKG